MTKIDKAAVAAMREAGESDRAIAIALGTTRQAIHAAAGPRAKPLGHPPAPLPSADPSRLPECLRLWRLNRGWTQATAAAAIGVHPMTWARWETGNRGCALSALVMDYLRLRDEKEKPNV